MTKLDDIKKTPPPAQALFPEAPAIAAEMQRRAEAHAWADLSRTSNPLDDIRAAMHRVVPALIPLGFAGPVPVDFTLASAALNRGEGPKRRSLFAPRGAR